jgi:hypothetical protein
MSFAFLRTMELERQLVERDLQRVKEESEQLRLKLLNEVKSNLDDLPFDTLIEIRNIIKEEE